MSRITMLDLAKRRNGSKEVGLIEANISHAPEVNMFPARTIEGTSFTTLLRTGLPTVGFGSLNTGVDPSKSTYEDKLVQAFVLRSLVQIDIAAATADSPIGMLQTDEANGVMEAAIRLIGRQIYYGVANDTKGFPGLQAMVNSALTISATGTTATTASSIYLVKFGLKDVQLIFGKQSVLALPPFRPETAYDSNQKAFDALVSHLTGWVGLQCTNPNSVARVCNVTADSGKGATDALLAAALAKFPTGVRPDAIFMSRRSRAQLQADRAARVSLRGDGKQTIGAGMAYAPTPVDFEGIPITATDSILDTEAIVS